MNAVRHRQLRTRGVRGATTGLITNGS